MATPEVRTPGPGNWLRHDVRDGWLIAATGIQAAVLAMVLTAATDAGPVATAASALVVAVSIWWNANTVAHIHMHRPIFVRRGLNRAFAAWLSLLTGIPQVVWRHRHLWHHAGEPLPRPRLRQSPQLLLELALIGAATAGLAALAPWVALLVWLPGFGLGMVFCQLQGHYEHARPGASVATGISHYSRWYNLLWFHDGYHIEHHLEPTRHWTQLPALRPTLSAHGVAIATSPLPPVLRGLEPSLRRVDDWLQSARNSALGALERLAIATGPLGRWMVLSHRRALRRLLAEATAAGAAPPREVVVVGGGLFPRTLLALEPLLPDARFVVIDCAPAHLQTMRVALASRPALAARVSERCGLFRPEDDAQTADLVILPLALSGDGDALAASCPCPVVAHRWLWSDATMAPGRAVRSVRVSLLLAKRVDWLAATAVER